MNNKRIFISFAVEDTKYRDFLVGQSRNNQSPFEFFDMSVKEPWDDSWKTRCRTKIKGCDGFIALISKNTYRADGARWEILCADQEQVPIMGIYCNSDDKPSLIPPEMNKYLIKNWTWDNIYRFIQNL